MNHFAVLFLLLCLPTLSFTLSLDMYQIPSTTTITLNGMQPNLKTAIHVHLVEIMIGTPPTPHYLIFDTASSFPWIQCEPCINCYRQANPRYDSTKSKTFRVIQCSERNCTGESCGDGMCHYQQAYGDGSTTQGVYARETFHFPTSSSSSTTSLPGMTFGCGKSQSAQHPATTLIEGVAGFGPGNLSLVHQLGKHAQLRFSHCFRLYTGEGMTRGRLRLGDDAKLSGPNVQRVQMLTGTFVNSYYLPLTDVSVGSKLVGFEPETFSPNGGYGGFIIDSGGTRTRFTPGPYEKIKEAFLAHYQQFNLYDVFYRPGMICYNNTKIQELRGPLEHPTMTLHFGTAKYIVKASELVRLYEGRFRCVTVFRSTQHVSVWGMEHQANHRITYDVGSNELSFVPADCNKVL